MNEEVSEQRANHMAKLMYQFLNEDPTDSRLMIKWHQLFEWLRQTGETKRDWYIRLDEGWKTNQNKALKSQIQNMSARLQLTGARGSEDESSYSDTSSISDVYNVDAREGPTRTGGTNWGKAGEAS